jgi:capsular polysaccharide biosynthesis protein
MRSSRLQGHAQTGIHPTREATPGRGGRTTARKLSSEALTAGDLYRVLWRHKFFILLLTIAFVAATWYATSRQTRTYEASTLVRIQEQGDTGNASLLAAQTLAQTYAKIIGSGALKGEIETLVAGCANQSLSTLKRSLPVTSPPRDRNSASSQNLRRTYARACRSIGITPRGRFAPRKVSEVSLSGTPVQDLDLLSISGRSKSPKNATIATNAAPLALRAFVRRTGSGTEKIVLVKPATEPSSPVSRQLPLKIAIAVMLGLIFNGALVLFFEFFRDRLPEPDELGLALGHPVLATVPALRLHDVATLTAARQESQSLGRLEQSLDGEGNSQKAGQRVGPEP